MEKIRTIKINILGASGTGKTTLGKALAEKFQCPHFDSDDYYHYLTDPPYKIQRSPQDRLDLLMTDLGKSSSWILSGGAAVWDPCPPVRYSLVVFLYLPLAIRLERLRIREKKIYGDRIFGGGDMETDHQEFMEWTKGYDDGTAMGTNTLKTHLTFLEQVKCPILKIEAPILLSEQVELVVDRITQTI